MSIGSHRLTFPNIATHRVAKGAKSRRKEPDEVSIKVKRPSGNIMNKIFRTTKRAAFWVLRALRNVCIGIFVLLVAIILVVLLIVAVIATAAEKFFALISSLIASLLAKIGKHLLGIK